jgi:hypothetical protein
MDSTSTINVETLEMNSDHDEALDDPDLYFGEKAVDKFWDFYKSDRKFKDFTQESDEIVDPRQAYIQTCTDLKVFPSAKLLIRDTSSPIIEYSNILLLDKSS